MRDDPIRRLRSADPLRGELPAPLERMPARPAPEPRERRPGSTALTVANVVLLVSVLLHGVDHAFIQDRGIGALSVEVVLGGAMITAAAALSLAAALRRDRRAALYALLSGPWIAAAVILGHFVGHWGEFSDRYDDAGLEPISYAFALAVVAAGIALGVLAALVGARSRTAAR